MIWADRQKPGFRLKKEMPITDMGPIFYFSYFGSFMDILLYFTGFPVFPALEIFPRCVIELVELFFPANTAADVLAGFVIHHLPRGNDVFINLTGLFQAPRSLGLLGQGEHPV